MTLRDIRIGHIEVTGTGREADVRAALAELPATLRALLDGRKAEASPLALRIARDVAAAIRRATPGEG